MIKKTLYLFISITLLLSQSNYEDVVYLKNGSRIQGVIIETVPGEYIKIKSGPNIFVYQMYEIEKLLKVELQEIDAPANEGETSFWSDSQSSYGSDTEDWYFSFGLGPSLTNNMEDLFNEDVSSMGIDFGFYWHFV